MLEREAEINIYTSNYFKDPLMHKYFKRFLYPIIIATILLGVMFIFFKNQTVEAKDELRVADFEIESASRVERQSIGEGIQISVDKIVASGFVNPVHLSHAGDGSSRLFVVEQPGRIMILQAGQVIPEPFMDITDIVLSGGERGLLSIAFHPNYENNRYFYVNYTRRPDGATVVARYQTSADPNLADPFSSRTLLTVPQPYANHNGGQIAFGADGYLYIGMGDGGSGGDPQNYAQNVNSLLGKILRIDVDQGDPYSIPPDNPFVDQEGADEIWALGLRNPWRFSFDSESDDLYIGDVGQGDWEEIDFQSAITPGGLNFGWRCKEANHIYNTSAPCNDPIFLGELIDPIAEYDHNSGQSVTGGFVYRGNLYPALTGYYFFADYVQGKIWSMISTGPGQWSRPIQNLDTNINISSFGEDETGELYVLDYKGGSIRRLADARGPTPDLSNSSKKVSPPNAAAGDIVTYTIQLINSHQLYIGEAPSQILNLLLSHIRRL
jgi:glucose/arabinose dehydrogenase